MKVTGFSYDTWNLTGTDLCVDLEAGEGQQIFGPGLSSKAIIAANRPLKADGSPIDQEWADALLAGEPILEHWITPKPDSPGFYVVQKSVMLIFVDHGIRTYNGYPQPHMRGPAEIYEGVQRP